MVTRKISVTPLIFRYSIQLPFTAARKISYGYPRNYGRVPLTENDENVFKSLFDCSFLVYRPRCGCGLKQTHFTR